MKRVLRFDAEPDLNCQRFKLLYEALKTAGLHPTAPRGIDVIRKENSILDVFDAVSDLDSAEKADPRELRTLREGVDSVVLTEPQHALLTHYIESGLVQWTPSAGRKVEDLVDWLSSAGKDDPKV